MLEVVRQSLRLNWIREGADADAEGGRGLLRVLVGDDEALKLVVQEECPVAALVADALYHLFLTH